MRVAVVGKDINFDRLALRAFGAVGVGRRVNVRRRRIRTGVWIRAGVRAWARTGIWIRVGLGIRLRGGVVVVSNDGRFHAVMAAVAVLRGHT